VIARALALLAFASAAWPATAQAVDDEDVALSLRPTLTLRLGYDSNARRVPHVASGDADDQIGLAVVGDGLLVASAGFVGSASAPGVVLRGSGRVGGKLFFDASKTPVTTPDYTGVRRATSTATERMVVAQAEASLLSRLPLRLTSRLDSFAKARMQASGARTYALSQSRWIASRIIGLGFSARGGLSGSVFHSSSTPLYSSFGGGLVAGGGFAPTLNESFNLEGGLDLRAYPFAIPCAELDQQGSCLPPPSPDVRRLDLPLRLSLTFTSVRRVFVSGGYALVRNISGTLGESFTRHRAFGMVGFKLPADVTATLRGALQITQYDEGISVAQQLFLREDDESQNSLSLGLSRPWAWGTHLEARVAWYGNELAQGGLEFSRTTAEMGVRFDL
jgi:hypothetical protein